MKQKFDTRCIWVCEWGWIFSTRWVWDSEIRLRSTLLSSLDTW